MSGTSPPARTNPLVPGSSTPRSTQSPTSWVAYSGFPPERVATRSATPPSRCSRLPTRRRLSASRSGSTCTQTLASSRHRSRSSAAASADAAMRSSRTVTTASSPAGSACARSRTYRMNWRVSLLQCTSSSHTTSGRWAARCWRTSSSTRNRAELEGNSWN
ncbi:MAG: hypothetical protein AMS20_05170 [Gemmatimonas sp. SG8_28]|nr:MAG: hypothetical protein AMS20_05170 [Gemmatimonas sp. SG8_28]